MHQLVQRQLSQLLQASPLKVKLPEAASAPSRQARRGSVYPATRLCTWWRLLSGVGQGIPPCLCPDSRVV